MRGADGFSSSSTPATCWCSESGGGRLLYHAPGSKLPEKYHLRLGFEDGSALTEFTQMWGAMELYEAGQEQERQNVKGMRVTPVEPEFTFDYFTTLIDSLLAGEKRSVKGLLTQDQLIPGLGNAIAQDMLDLGFTENLKSQLTTTDFAFYVAFGLRP